MSNLERTPASIVVPGAPGDPRQSARRFDIDKRIAILLLSLFFIPSLIVDLRDRRAWPWDEAFYGTFSVSLFHTLLRSPLHWPTAMVRALGDRAPGIAWIGQFFVPLGHALPFTQTGLLCFTLTTQAASIFLLFALLNKSFGKTLPALMACCITASGPLLTGLTNSYLVEPLQALCTVWVLWLAVYQDRLSRPILFLHVTSAVAAGLLAKISTPLFQLPALLFLVVVFLRKRPVLKPGEKMWASRSCLYASLLITVLIVWGTAAWYLENFQTAVQHVVEASSGSASLFYGHRGSLPTKFAWWSEQFQKAFFWVPVLASILLVFPRAFFVRFRQGPGLTVPDVLALLSSCGIAGILTVFSLNVNEDTRYLFALLPYVAFVVCWVAANVRLPALVALLGALAAAQFAMVTAQAYGAIRPSAGLSNYLQPYQTNDLALRDSIFCALKTSDSSPERPTFTGEGVPAFNANGLTFYSTIEGGQGRNYVGLGWDQTDALNELRRIKASGCRYYVYRKFPEIGDTDPPNQIAKALFARVVNDRGFSFRPDKSNDRVLVFETTAGGLRYTGGDDGVVSGFQGVDPSARLPYGLMELPKKGDTLQGKKFLEVSGWAVSPSGIGRIEILLDDRQVANASHRNRPDVARAYPDAESTGFGASIDLGSLADGPHQAAVIVHSRDGLSRRIASVSISTSSDFPGVNPEKQLPFGLLESPKEDTFLDKSGVTLIQGWTVSPTPIERVEILLDGKHLTDAAKMNRPDVRKTYPGLISTGFTAAVDFSSLAGGQHVVSAITYSQRGSRVLARTSVNR